MQKPKEYLVFENIVELNKDEDLTAKSLEYQPPPMKPRTNYIGNHRILWIKNQKIILTLGPHWPFFMFMYSLLFATGFAMIIYVMPKYNNTLINIATVIVTFFELFIYSLTALKNPGIILQNDDLKDDLENKQKKKCPKCGVYQNHYTHHCIDCNVCIDGYDHHCMWTGKCIGKGNLAYFHIFLTWTALYLCFCIFLSVFSIPN